MVGWRCVGGWEQWTFLLGTGGSSGWHCVCGAAVWASGVHREAVRGVYPGPLGPCSGYHACCFLPEGAPLVLLSLCSGGWLVSTVRVPELSAPPVPGQCPQAVRQSHSFGSRWPGNIAMSLVPGGCVCRVAPGSAPALCPLLSCLLPRCPVSELPEPKACGVCVSSQVGSCTEGGSPATSAVARDHPHSPPGCAPLCPILIL